MAEKLKCSLCGKEATVHLTQIINNKIHKVDLCEACAQQKGVTDPEGFALAELLEKSNVTPQQPPEEQLSCPSCGYETADFRRSGRLGCATCYEVFESQIRPVLEDMHAGTAHNGKVPELAMERQCSQLKLRKLKDALTRAIADEAYEQAATIRDEIRALEAAEAAAALETSLQ